MAEDEIQCIAVDMPTCPPSSWDDVEKLLHHGFYNELRIAPEEHPILLSESTFANPQAREKLTQIMFETFNTPLFLIRPTSVMGVYAAGSETGISVHLGENSSEIVPVINGVPQRDIAVEYPITGSYITGYVRQAVSTALPNLSASELKAAVFDCKKIVRVELDPANPSTTSSTTIGLVDGSTFDLGNKCWLSTEMIFYPELVGKGQSPLAETILRLVSKCPEEHQRTLLKCISLSGGAASYTGFRDRLQKDLDTLLRGFGLQVKVFGDATASYTPWVGLSILGSLSTFADQGMHTEHYDEVGPSGIHTFCS